MTASELSNSRTSHTLDLIRRNRRKILSLVEGLSADRLTKIPAGFRNHMLWNVGHVAVAQQVLCYKMSGLPTLLPAEARDLFGKGTDPSGWNAIPDPETVKAWLLPPIDAMEADIGRGAFVAYEPYETSMGNRLTSLSEALDHVIWHEGVHLGTLLALRKLV
jgi:hypothetical protein